MKQSLCLLADQYLAALFTQPGWQLRSNLPCWACLVVPNWEDVCYLAEHYCASLARSFNQRVPIYIEYGGSDRHTCQITSTGKIMNITIGEIEVNRALLDCFGEMLSCPERSLGLVRLNDEKQVTVSGGAGGSFLGSFKKEDAQKLYRSDYWHPQDLREFNRDWQRSLSVDGEWMEYTYRSFDLAGDRSTFNRRFTTRYKLVQAPQGLFHYCENLGVEMA